MQNKQVILTPEEQELMREQLQDVQAHWEDFLECGVFEPGVETEEMIKKVDLLEGIIGKLS